MEQVLTPPPAPTMPDIDPAAQRTVTAAHAALFRFTGPLFELEPVAGELALSFDWHDGARYRLTLRPDGELLRLYRLQYTGGWVFDEAGQVEVPAETWRTVRQLQRDRAGKLLGPAMAGFRAASSWREAAAR